MGNRTAHRRGTREPLNVREATPFRRIQAAPPRLSSCDDALSDIKRLSGVVGVTNGLTVRPAPASDDVKGQIENALGRQALLEGSIVQVSVQDGTVILSGAVHSWAQRAAARDIAWAGPGVSDVVDNLRIETR